MHAQSLSCVWLLGIAVLWTVALQAPLSMEFSRQEYWSGLPFPPPGDPYNSGIEPTSSASPALTGRFFYHWATWETLKFTPSMPNSSGSKWVSESRSVVSDSLRPHGLYSPWNSLDQNTGVGSFSLFQVIFPTERSNPGLPHCRQILFFFFYYFFFFSFIFISNRLITIL